MSGQFVLSIGHHISQLFSADPSDANSSEESQLYFVIHSHINFSRTARVECGFVQQVAKSEYCLQVPLTHKLTHNRPGGDNGAKMLTMSLGEYIIILVNNAVHL